MSKISNLEDDFKLISYKRRNKKVVNKFKLKENIAKNTTAYNKETAIRRIHEAKQDILLSDLYSSLLASLRESQSALLDPQIQYIICLGLGRIGECTVARYQLGLLLCLRDLFKVKVSIFDPVLTEIENDLLTELECQVLHKNVEGKYLAEKTTLFFLPHCPKQLSNNLIWANWGLNLSNCIIIANSFSNLLERNTKRLIQENAAYILNISPYTLEIAVINMFKYYDVFNDLAVHVFPYKSLCLISDDFWKYNHEPKYLSDDIEFITNKLNELYIKFLIYFLSLDDIKVDNGILE